MTISKKLKIFSIQILLSVIPLSIFISTDLSAELIIKVTKGNDKPTEIAISPIASGNINLSEDLGLIIESDLQRSGMFKTIPRQNMLAYHQLRMTSILETGVYWEQNILSLDRSNN